MAWQGATMPRNHPLPRKRARVSAETFALRRPLPSQDPLDDAGPHTDRPVSTPAEVLLGLVGPRDHHYVHGFALEIGAGQRLALRVHGLAL